MPLLSEKRGHQSARIENLESAPTDSNSILDSSAEFVAQPYLAHLLAAFDAWYTGMLNIRSRK